MLQTIDHTNESVYCTHICEDLTCSIFPIFGAALRKEMKPTNESLKGNKGNDWTPEKCFVRKAGGEVQQISYISKAPGKEKEMACVPCLW